MVTAKEGSDVDLLVEFVPGAKIDFFTFDEIEENFEKEIGRTVDLVTDCALSKFFRDTVISEAEILYQS